MRQIRIGNDIKLVWSIFDGYGQPYELKKERKLTLKCRNFLYNIEDYTVDGNKITFTFFGKDQTTVGTYILTLVENDDEVGMQTVDCCNAFRLVPTSCEQTIDNGELNPEVTSLNLTSNIDYYTEGGGGSTPITEVVVKDITLSAIYDNVNLNVTKTNNTQSTISLPQASEIQAGILTRDLYLKIGLLDNQYEVDDNAYLDLNNCLGDGEYKISNQTASAYLNWPLQNESTVSGKLTVLTAYESNNPVTTQLLYLNNCSGGDANMYIRAKQGDVWEKWGKLQTNIEVGFTISYDEYTDNGMYSGVFDNASTRETFVLIVINDYMANQFMGRNEKSITQLKFALSTANGTQTIKTRNKPYNTGTWSEWSDVGGSSITVDTALSTTSTNAVQNKVIAQAIDNKADKSSVVNQTATTVTIEPNTLNVWGSVTELNITLGAEKTGVINEYMIQFTSGDSVTSLVLPANIKWLSAPTITENKVYQISIINKLAVIAEFPNE